MHRLNSSTFFLIHYNVMVFNKYRVMIIDHLLFFFFNGTTLLIFNQITLMHTMLKYLH